MEFSEILSNELFNSAWEVRHGAATLIREIVKRCGGSAGITSPDEVGAKIGYDVFWSSLIPTKYVEEEQSV